MKKLFVIGNPVKHSLSPEIHNHWLVKYKTNCVYEKLELDKDPERLEDQQKQLIRQIRLGEVMGVNITVPFKQRFQKYVDEEEQNAVIAQAINTIYRRDNKLIGSNTDGIGFYNSLVKDFNCNVPKVIHILGAGGASYGILSELLNYNVKIVNISNRTESKAEMMVNHFKKIKKFSSTKFHLRNIYDPPDQTVGMFINTSSIGMKGNQMDENKFESLFTLLSRDAIVYDINYNKSQTIFNKLAENQKLNSEKILNGKFMLIRQAAESFNKWFGIKLTKQDIGEGIKILEKFI